MTRQPKICRECGYEFIPIKKNRVNCSTECTQTQRKKQWHQKIVALPENTHTNDSDKIKMPKIRLTDQYPWENFNSLGSGRSISS